MHFNLKFPASCAAVVAMAAAAQPADASILTCQRSDGGSVTFDVIGSRALSSERNARQKPGSGVIYNDKDHTIRFTVSVLDNQRGISVTKHYVYHRTHHVLLERVENGPWSSLTCSGN